MKEFDIRSDLLRKIGNYHSVDGHSAGKLLWHLSFKFKNVCNRDLVEFERVPLAGLILTGTRVTDRGMPSIAKQRWLEWLDLAGCRITNKALVLLGEMPNLEWLNLEVTPVSKQAVITFSKLNPKCRIGWEGGELLDGIVD